MKILKLNPKKNKAQAIIEFAIALPILLLILYGVMEAGRYILIVSSVNNATRQAARYGSTSGVNPVTGVPRYQDCQGIKDAALRTNFMRSFANNNITITYDAGPSTSAKAFSPCDGTTDTGVDPSTSNSDRITVSISARYNAILPRLVPFISRTINASSSRTIVRSISIQQAVAKEVTTTTITASTPVTSEIGQTVRVYATAAGNTTPTGTIAITGADTPCTINLTNGETYCDVVFNTVVTSLPETRTLVATYSGDSSHDASSGTQAHTVIKAFTAATIIADTPDPSAVNATLTAVTVTVTSAWGTPTGTVAITGADTNCTITLSGGSGSCNTVKFTSAGSKTLTATYSGDTSHFGDDETVSHTVLSATQTTTTINNPASSASLTVTFSTTVSGLTTPAGSVVFKEGATTLCTVTLSSGTGTCTYTFASPGVKTVTATYTSTNGMTTSNATQTITIGNTTTTITAGTPVNGVVPITATVTGSGTITGKVDISGANINCTITLVNGTGTCNVTFTSSVTNATLTGIYTPTSSHYTSQGTTTVTATVVTTLSCEISSYTVNNWNDGNGGFGATIGIKNTGTTTINNNWVLTWTFPGTQTVTGMWNPSTYTQSGKIVTATSSATNGGSAINAGATFSSMGFNGTGALPYPTNNYPVDFKLNGTACTPPPIANCSTSKIVVSKMQFPNGTLDLPINNTLPSAILIKDVTVTWYQDKGHGTGNDKTLVMQSATIVSASFGNQTIWTGSDADGTNIFTPASAAYIPPGASTLKFAYQQTQDRWDDESITINLSTPGCTTVVLSAPVGYHQ